MACDSGMRTNSYLIAPDLGFWRWLAGITDILYY